MAASEISEDSERDILAEDRKRSRKTMAASLGLMAFLLLACVWIGLAITAKVPDVTGKTPSEATSMLEKAGFKAELAEGLAEGGDATSDGTGTSEKTSFEPGTVALQSPMGGTRVLKGTRVEITLAAGTSVGGGGSGNYKISGGGGLPEPFTRPEGNGSGRTMVPSNATPPDNRPMIPIVGDMPQASAVAALQAAGYRVTVLSGPSTAGILEGHVYAQTPAFGSRASRGTLVTIYVSTGAPGPGEYSGAPIPSN